MTDPLPPFNLASCCPKCGMAGGGPPAEMPPPFSRMPLPPPPPRAFPAEYHRYVPFAPTCALDLQVEHLCRVCPRCGFRWPEACVRPAPKDAE